MNVSCDIICDLLPLYAEDMVSQASRDMVDEHLCGCDACMKELGRLKKADKVPAEVNTESLKRVGKSIHYRRILAVLTVLFFAATVVMGIALLLDARIYLPAEQAVESVESRENGSIRVKWTDQIIGIGNVGTGRRDTDDPTGNFGIIAYSNLRKMLFPKPVLTYAEQSDIIRSTMTEEGYNSLFDCVSISVYQLGGEASTVNFWYCSAKNGRGETLLWDAGNPYPEAPLCNVNYHLAYYCGGLAILAAILAGIAYSLRKRGEGKLVLYASVFFGCISVSTVIACAGQFMELWGEFTESVLDGWILTVPMFAAAMCAMKLHSLTKQDKGL